MTKMNPYYNSAIFLLFAFFYATTVLANIDTDDDFLADELLNIDLIYKIGIKSEKTPNKVGQSQETKEGAFAEIQVKASGIVSDDWSYGLGFRAYASSTQSTFNFDEVESGRDIKTSDNNSFLHLRHIWLRYKGLTDLPDEHITLGLQRIRSNNSILWDSEIESVVWRLSSTRAKVQTGVGQMFDTYQTNTEIRETDEDKTRAFLEVTYDWMAYHEITFDCMFASQDTNNLPSDIQIDSPDGANGDWLWYGAALSSNWKKRRSNSGFAYNLQWIGLQGKADFQNEDNSDLTDHDINAWAFDGGLRLDLQENPVSIGVTYSYGSGGFENDESNMFVQTGLHTNYGSFTGNSHSTYRFNQALRPDLTNLSHFGVFLSSTVDKNHLLNLMVSKFQRNEDDLPIYRFGSPLELEEGSSDIGFGGDLAYLYKVEDTYLNIPIKHLRLRSSAFVPGDAFPEDSDSTIYSIIFEITGVF